MLTLNQIIAQITTLADAHYQIEEVGVGTIAELQGKPDRLYPLLWLSVEECILEDNYKIDNIRLTMFGRVITGEEGQDDDASELEVLSDTQLILLDFLNYFHQQHGQEYVTDKSGTLEHFTERTNDRTAGYSVVLELKQFYDWNKCQIPESGASIPPTVDGLTLYDFCDQSVIDRLTATQLACLQAEFGASITINNQAGDWSVSTLVDYTLPFARIVDSDGSNVDTADYKPVADGAMFTCTPQVKEITISIPVETGDDTASFTVVNDSDGTIDTVDQDGLTTFAVTVNAVSVSVPFDLDVADAVIITFDAAGSDSTIVLTGTYT